MLWEVSRRERIINKTGVWHMCVLCIICRYLIRDKFVLGRMMEEINAILHKNNVILRLLVKWMWTKSEVCKSIQKLS